MIKLLYLQKKFINNQNKFIPIPGQFILLKLWNIQKQGLPFYIFTGICISVSRKNINSSFILRNVLNFEAFEQRFLVYSKIIKNIILLKRLKFEKPLKLSKYYFIRTLPTKLSEIKFNLYKNLKS